MIAICRRCRRATDDPREPTVPTEALDVDPATGGDVTADSPHVVEALCPLCAEERP